MIRGSGVVQHQETILISSNSRAGLGASGGIIRGSLEDQLESCTSQAAGGALKD